MDKNKSDSQKVVSQNKKAYRDYFIEDKVEAGLVLLGSEVKSLRIHGAQMAESYVDLRNGMPEVYNLHITHWDYATHNQHEPTRVRKLLLHKKEIEKIIREMKPKGYSLIPLKIYFKGPYAKIELGLAKGKKNYDKREDLKKQDHQREMDRFRKIL
jgi:SsrA-binding protein